MRRGTNRRQVLIEVPAARAWELVGRPDLLHHWFPGMVDCTVDGDQRTVHLGSGVTMVETILANDPLQRRFQYTVTGGFLSEHLGTVDVLEVDEGRCLVTYATDVRPAVMSLVLGGATGGALEELRRQLESGAGPAIDALARPVVET